MHLKQFFWRLYQHREGRWYIDLDISAPKLIVPETVLEENPALVVMDLGNFRLKTVSTEETKAAMEEEGLHWSFIFHLLFFIYLILFYFCYIQNSTSFSVGS
jgi:hypothetical protein